jgi:hypothetical protein
MLDRKTHEHTQRTGQVCRGIIDASIGVIHQLFRLLAHGARDLARENILVEKMIVEAALGYIRDSDDLINGNAVDITSGEQRATRIQERGARALPSPIRFGFDLGGCGPLVTHLRAPSVPNEPAG